MWGWGACAARAIPRAVPGDGRRKRPRHHSQPLPPLLASHSQGNGRDMDSHNIGGEEVLGGRWAGIMVS